MVALNRSSRVVVDLVPRSSPESLLAELLAQDLHHLNRIDEASLRQAVARIRRVLIRGSMVMALQPIFDLDAMEPVGYEALARFAGPPDRPPDRWFAEAADVGLGEALEMMAVRAALACLDELPPDAYLAVNVSPELLQSPELLRALSGVRGDRIVLELTEHAPVDRYAALRLCVERLRAMGVRLAVDDVGAGFATLQHIVILRPDVMKLDMTLVRRIDADPARRSLAGAMARFAHDVGASLTAEGIERPEELTALREAGVRFGQGFHLGLPAPVAGAGGAA